MKIKIICSLIVFFMQSLLFGQNQTPTAIIKVNGKPILNGEITVKAGERVNFRGDSSSDPDNDSLVYSWDFGDGSKSSSINPSHTYNNAGTYSVKLTVDDKKSSGNRTRIIFDTDFAHDVDDLGALAVIHTYAIRGRIEILAIGVNGDMHNAVDAVDAVNTYFKKPNIPIGYRDNRRDYVDHYQKHIADRFHHDQHQTSAPRAVDVYRKALAAAPDNSVVIITVGYIVNIVDLLKSGPDKHSPLNGIELVRKKAKKMYSQGAGTAIGRAGTNLGAFNNGNGVTKFLFENFPRPLIT